MRATTVPRGRRAERGRRTIGLAAAAAVLLTLLLPTASAIALPPDGAGADTPGTSSSVSPTTLQACQTISYTVSGYPGGETLYIKIDDGAGYSDQSVQGSGVVAMQAIPASGTVSGSFELPCNIATGAHWLRFLASQVKYDSAGNYQGTIGFTRRGGADFTVVAGTSGSGTSGGTSSSGLGAAAPAAGATTGSGSEQVAGQGSTLSIDPDAVGGDDASATPEATASATPIPSPTGTLDAAAASDIQSVSVPWIGIVVLVVLLIVGGLVVWLVLRRRPSASAR